MKSEQQYIDLYNEAGALIKQKSCDVMNAVRDNAFAVFKEKGFPTKKVERYKYTDVDAAFAPNYGISLGAPTISPKGEGKKQYIFTFKNAPIDLTSYYNKIAMPGLSPEGTLPLGGDGRGFDALAALNTALAHEGLLIYVPKNERPADPIVVDNWLLPPSGERGLATMMVRRVLIVLEQGAEATIIINDKAPSNSPKGENSLPDRALPLGGDGGGLVRFLTSQVVEVVCKDNSRLDMYEIEETTPLCSRFSNVYIKEGRDCSVKHNSITLFNGQTRNLCDVYLTGENSEVTLNGCAIGGGSQRIDNNTLIDHKVPGCRSNELYKYVVDDKSVGAFAGKILVEHDAQKTSSQETNANLCASKEARMFTQPMLEIYADDVKCAHGSTVGVMDETALFYMRQRGIPEDEARTLLKNAFMGQVIDQITLEPLRQKLYVKVEKRFRGELDKCEDCRLCK